MIFGDFVQWENEKESYTPVLKKALEFLKETNFNRLEPGNYPMGEGDIKAMLKHERTKARDEGQFESHRQNIDIHYLLEGEETIGFARHNSNAAMTVNELERSDYALYDKVHYGMELVLKPGMFAIFFPADLHSPCLSTEAGMEIKKVVVKINKDLL